MMAGRRQHDIVEEIDRLVAKHCWWHFLVLLRIEGGLAGIGTAIKAAR